MEAALLPPGNLVEFILTNLRSTKCASHCVRREVERQVLNFVTQTDIKTLVVIPSTLQNKITNSRTREVVANNKASFFY